MYFQWYYPNLQLFKFINAAESNPDELFFKNGLRNYMNHFNFRDKQHFVESMIILELSAKCFFFFKLTHFWPMYPFNTLWEHQKTFYC